MYFDIDCFMSKQLDKHNNNKDNILLFIEHKNVNINNLGPRECKNKENSLRIANYCFGSR